MAKERSEKEAGEGLTVRIKKKKKTKIKDGSSKRPKFCPNSSKSFNLSRTAVQHRSVSVTKLKKNNEELAKALNTHKVNNALLISGP